MSKLFEFIRSTPIIADDEFDVRAVYTYLTKHGPATLTGLPTGPHLTVWQQHLWDLVSSADPVDHSVVRLLDYRIATCFPDPDNAEGSPITVFCNVPGGLHHVTTWHAGMTNLDVHKKLAEKFGEQVSPNMEVYLQDTLLPFQGYLFDIEPKSYLIVRVNF